MNKEEREKVRQLAQIIKEKGVGFDRDTLLIVGTFAFCEDADKYGGTLHILDEMIKILEEHPNVEEFMARVGRLVGLD